MGGLVAVIRLAKGSTARDHACWHPVYFRERWRCGRRIAKAKQNPHPLRNRGVAALEALEFQHGPPPD